jgi:hypothetical protein
MASARVGLPLLLAHDDARGSVVEPSGRAFVLRLDSSQPVRVHLGVRSMDALTATMAAAPSMAQTPATE